jgi:hypothetical protein
VHPIKLAILLSVAFFAGLLVCLEIGYRIGCYGSRKDPELTHKGIGAIDTAVFALLGLLLGFSFAGGVSRLDAHRQLITQEANAIGTAYLRLDLLPKADQPELRYRFREYLEARLRAYDKLPDLEATDRELAHAAQISQEIWFQAVISSATDTSHNSARLLLPALNEMIDITTGRTLAIHTHTPPLVFSLLVAVALLTSLLAGYAMQKRQSRSLFHMLLYSAAVAATLYVVLDLDYPRHGLIRLDTADKLLLKLRDSIK